jgi:hypothetical protein
MAAPETTLDVLDVGAVLLFGGRLEARDPTDGLRVGVFTRDRVKRFVLTIAPDLTISGQSLFPLSQIPAQPITLPFKVGDVVQNDRTREILVVTQVWATVENYGFAWSNTPDRRTVYTPEGWTKIGTATMT